MARQTGPGAVCKFKIITHRRHEPILVARKTLTKSSTYVKFVIKFVGTANLTNIMKFREPLNNYSYQLWLCKPHKLKLWVGLWHPQM